MSAVAYEHDDAPSVADMEPCFPVERIVRLGHDHDGYRVDISDDDGRTWDGAYLDATTITDALREARAMLRDGETLDASELDDAISDARDVLAEQRAARGAA